MIPRAQRIGDHQVCAGAGTLLTRGQAPFGVQPQDAAGDPFSRQPLLKRVLQMRIAGGLVSTAQSCSDTHTSGGGGVFATHTHATSGSQPSCGVGGGSVPRQVGFGTHTRNAGDADSGSTRGTFDHHFLSGGPLSLSAFRWPLEMR